MRRSHRCEMGIALVPCSLSLPMILKELIPAGLPLFLRLHVNSYVHAVCRAILAAQLPISEVTVKQKRAGYAGLGIIVLLAGQISHGPLVFPPPRRLGASVLAAGHIAQFQKVTVTTLPAHQPRKRSLACVGISVISFSSDLHRGRAAPPGNAFAKQPWSFRSWARSSGFAHYGGGASR